MDDETVLETVLPKFEKTMLPLLKILQNKEIHKMKDCVDKLANQFNLSEEQRELRKKSSKTETLWTNRTHWGRNYLMNAGLVKNPKRGYVQITDEGLKILERDLENINIKILREFPKFVEYENRKKNRITSQVDIKDETPDDAINRGIATINEQVRIELLEKLHNIEPFEFESLTLKLLERLGYGKGKVTKKSGDGGIDGYLEKDVFGFEKISFQSKRYRENVPVAKVREFLGSVPPGQKGIMITTSDYSPDLEKTLNETQRSRDEIKFVNGERLVDMMMEHEIGVKIVDTEHTYEIDFEFFDSVRC